MCPGEFVRLLLVASTFYFGLSANPIYLIIRFQQRCAQSLKAELIGEKKELVSLQVGWDVSMNRGMWVHR